MSLLQRTASALAGDRTGKSDLNLDQIRLDGGTQPRAEINMEVVRDYADALTNGIELPAVTVFYDGTSYWLADGYHRLAAHKLADKRSILADVRQGTQREAVLWSVGANAEHGLRRTDEDKRRAVLRLLEDQEWGGWSDREIARQCKVGNKFVGDVRRSLTVSEHSETPRERTYTTKHGTRATMNTAPIAAASTERATRQAKKPAPQSLTAAFDNAAYQTDSREAAADAAAAEYQAAQAARAAAVKKHLDGWMTDSYRLPPGSLKARISTLRGLGAGKTAGAEFVTRGALVYLDKVGMNMDREELQRHASALADELEPQAQSQDARLGRLRATVAAVLESLEDDDLRNAAAAARVGPAYGQAIEMLRTVQGAI